jgi:hypothetical protein
MKDFFSDETNIPEKKINKKRIIIAVLMGVIIIALIATYIVYSKNQTVRNWIDVYIFQKEVEQDSVSTIEYNSENNAEICAYDKYIGILSKNELTLYNNSGKEETTLDIPISNVIFNSSNRFLGIAEQDGQNVYLISGNTIAWENEIEGNISQISVNKNGYMAVVISGTSHKTVISLYDPTGKELFKIYLSTTRVASVSISNDNKYLALAEIDTSSSIIQSNVKVISIEDAKQKAENSVTYIYNAEPNKLLINIKYADKNNLVCMYSDSIDILQEEENKQLISLESTKTSFLSIDLNNNIALVEEKASGLFTADSDIEITNVSNEKTTIYTVEAVAKSITAYGDIIALNLGSELHFVNTSGWLVKKYVASQEITNIVLSNNLAGIIYRDKIDIVNL